MRSLFFEQKLKAVNTHAMEFSLPRISQSSRDNLQHTAHRSIVQIFYVMSPILIILVVAGHIFANGLFFDSDSINEAPEARHLDESSYGNSYSLFPLSLRDILGLVAAAVGLIVAAGGGIGGGGMLVPIYILVMRFYPKHAIPLSNVTVFGGAIANTLLNASKRHPHADRPLIDWDLILVMEPLTLAGALIGANLNKLLPEFMILVMLVVLLSFTSYKTLHKALKLYHSETAGWTKVAVIDDHESKLKDLEMGTTLKKESKLLVRSKSDSKVMIFRGMSNMQSRYPRRCCSMPAQEITSSPATTPGSRKLKQGLFSTLISDHMDEKKEENAEETNKMPFAAAWPIREHAMAGNDARRKEILERERHTPRGHVLVIIGLFILVLFVNIGKGGGAFPSPVGIECGSLAYWATEAIILVLVALVSIKSRSYLLRKSDLKKEVNYVYQDCDIQWDPQSTFVYPTLCCIAGIVAGMFGIGGGIVKAPLMLALGVHPTVASATSACMILFTSFTATSSFFLFGLLEKEYAVMCGLLGFVATLVGQTVMSYLLQRNQRTSYVAFCIGGVVALSAVLMTVESLVSFGSSQSGSGLCTSGDA